MNEKNSKLHIEVGDCETVTRQLEILAISVHNGVSSFSQIPVEGPNETQSDC